MSREPSSTDPRQVVDRFEQTVTSAERRRGGVHYTPHEVAAQLTELAMSNLDGPPGTVCDPSCGAGAFLLAAADALVERGVDPIDVVTSRLVGAELDPQAASAARSAMRCWADGHGVDRSAPDVAIVVGDALELDPETWPLRAQGYDLVIGNPPFLGQLATATARTADQRAAATALLGSSSGYTDTAALFLLASARLARPGGLVLLLQPQSFLSARSTVAVRDRLTDEHTLVALWGSDDQLFDAAVRVCAPLIRCHSSRDLRRSTASAGGVQLWWTAPHDQRRATSAPVVGESWGRLGATAHGLPVASAHGGATIASIASATAGFRDEFYALAGAAVESRPDQVDHRSLDEPRLVTVGMIDPAELHWGRDMRRLAGRRWIAPRVDLEQLAAAAPRVARWCRQRLVPKVLLATQTRVIEAVGDPLGDLVPVTPTISVEPHDPSDLWLTAAALSAPPVSARAAADHFGSGLGGASVRLSARSVLDLEVPLDAVPWNDAAVRLRRLSERTRRSAEDSGGGPDVVRAEWEQIGRLLCAAHHIDADPVLQWWLPLVAKRVTV